ncbi:MAG: hypothetical protein ABIE74_10960 [Pseudomonadota bacterium]
MLHRYKFMLILLLIISTSIIRPALTHAQFYIKEEKSIINQERTLDLQRTQELEKQKQIQKEAVPAEEITTTEEKKTLEEEVKKTEEIAKEEETKPEQAMTEISKVKRIKDNDLSSNIVSFHLESEKNTTISKNPDVIIENADGANACMVGGNLELRTVIHFSKKDILSFLEFSELTTEQLYESFQFQLLFTFSPNDIEEFDLLKNNAYLIKLPLNDNLELPIGQLQLENKDFPAMYLLELDNDVSPKSYSLLLDVIKDETNPYLTFIVEYVKKATIADNVMPMIDDKAIKFEDYKLETALIALDRVNNIKFKPKIMLIIKTINDKVIDKGGAGNEVK